MKFPVACRRFYPIKESEIHPVSSILEAQDKQPLRLKPLSDGAYFLYAKSCQITTMAIDAFTKVNTSLADVLCLNLIYNKLKAITVESAIIDSSPFILAGCVDYFTPSQISDHSQKSILSLVILGYLMTERITEKPEISHMAYRIMHKAAGIFSFITLHTYSYQIGYNFGQKVFASFETERYINQVTKDNLSILTAIISTGCILPALLLQLAKFIDKSKLFYEARRGFGTQSSRLASIQVGMTSEVNSALILYDHFMKQLMCPERLFQYFIVSLNVLKDTDTDQKDPLKKNPVVFLNKIRNVWLLAIDSIAQAKSDFFYKSEEIYFDQKANSQIFNVIRAGRSMRGIQRYQLRVGDLVSMDQVVRITCDQATGHKKMSVTMSGYLIQTDEGQSLKKVAISLVELNGENQAVILIPAQKPKTKKELQSVDLLTIPTQGSILPGAEIISFDNGNPEASPAGLYLQIAKACVILPSHKAKTPLSLIQIKDLKKKLIITSLVFAALAAPPLMEYKTVPLRLKKLIQYYGAQFVDKFSQVFSESQTIIPLVSEVLLEMVNSNLVKEVNQKLEHKMLLNDVLCVSDLFEFLRQKKLKIFSDKTGTVTETFMILKDIKPIQEAINLKAVVKAFATTYSDQKTESEENEIKRYLFDVHGITLETKPTSGHYGALEKTLSHKQSKPITFTSKRLGLFNDWGGQFTLRLEEGSKPVLVFCGIPRAQLAATPLFQAYQDYELQELENMKERKESLTRDWCIAECQISSDHERRFDEASYIEDLLEKKMAIQVILEELKHDLVCLGVFQIDNPIKKGAKDAIRKWKAASIDFMLITGDTKNASKLIASKLYDCPLENVYDLESLVTLQDFETEDLSRHCVIFNDTTPASLELLDRLNAKKELKPNLIFCQMKDVDKKILCDHAKNQGFFIMASGDGCNDLLMFNSAHIALANSAHDGSFAKGVQEAATFTDQQIKQLMENKEASIYELLDLEAGKKSLFLKPFARMSNTQPKIITALMAKSLKSMAVPRILGKLTKEIPGQFGAFLAYDGAYLSAIYKASLDTASTPLLNRAVHQDRLPLIVLITSLAIASLQSMYAYTYYNEQITTSSMLALNLALAVSGLFVFLAPPGYKAQSE